MDYLKVSVARYVLYDARKRVNSKSVSCSFFSSNRLFVCMLLLFFSYDIVKTNRPFPSYCEPHYEKEDKCKAFHMKINFVCM